MANFLLFHEKGIKDYWDETTGFYTLEAVKVLPDSDRFHLAGESGLPVEIQKYLLENGSYRVLCQLAKYSKEPEIIERLSKLDNSFILESLISNPNTPLEILQELSNHRLMVVEVKALKTLCKRYEKLLQDIEAEK